MMVAFIGWFTGTGSSSSTGVDSSGGGGSWGAFTPNVGGFASGGSGFDSFGGFGIGSGRGDGFGDSSFALDRGSGGGGGWGAFQPTDDGFTNSEPLGGYAGTSPNYNSVTNLERVTVTAPKPNYDPIGTLFNEQDPLFGQTNNELPITDIGTRVRAVLPDEHADLVLQRQIDETIRRDQSRLFEYFTGPIGSIYSGIKSAFNRDWWGVSWAVIGLIPAGKLAQYRMIRNVSLAGKNHPVTGIPFNSQGFPDFSSVAIKEVKIPGFTNRYTDATLANRAAGLADTPEGYVWHHGQDGRTMQLVPEDIHAKTGHTGGYSIRDGH